MGLSASFVFYSCLLLSLVTIKVAHVAPVFGLFTAALLWLAYRNLRTSAWPVSGELSAASIIGITILASLPSALGLV
jgi:hypothetical protein